MSCRVIDNNAYELAITPSRKRKRDAAKFDAPLSQESKPAVEPASAPAACFTNAAFSSTPKRIGKRLLPKENLKPFEVNPFLEVKSILDLVQDQKQQQHQQKSVKAVDKTDVPENPYEVVRKPPKKKKKCTEIEEACFENPALNLELPEKQFNPFEVHREPARLAVPVSASKCFVNEALNLRGQDVPASRNPFEIPRCSAVSIGAANPDGVENLALETPQPSALQIGLPFTPTVGCRIDFTNLPLSQLTPSKLLAEKLVFSPVPTLHPKTPKRSLSSISEETMDIGKELDRYQLELENSINEAKLRKNGGGGSIMTEEVTIEVEQKVTFTQKLTEIAEAEEENPQPAEAAKADGTEDETKQEEEPEIEGAKPVEEDSLPLLAAREEIAEDQPPSALEKDEGPKEDAAVYESDEDDFAEDDMDLNFKAPAPFVRAYRRAEPPKLTVSKESLNSVKSDKSAEAAEQPKKSGNVMKSMIRNSIRKLMHPHAKDKHSEKEKEEAGNEAESEKHQSAPSTIMSSIRHSLRRNPKKQQLVEEELEQGEGEGDFPPTAVAAAEISIIDSSERTMKLKSNLVQTDYARIEELTTEKKHSLRSSIRRSTREVRNQLMKTVFHKTNEEYAFRK